MYAHTTTFEQALVARAPPAVMAARVRAALIREMSKGCTPDLSSHPVALEPAYAPIDLRNPVTVPQHLSIAVPEPEADPRRLLRRHIWLSPNHRFDWKRSELFLRQLAGVSHRIGFEIVGNARAIEMRLLFDIEDQPIVQAAFDGQFGKMALSNPKRDQLDELPQSAWLNVVFRDYFPQQPYSNLLSDPESLEISPFESLTAALAKLPPYALGIYQVLFQPVASIHAWHRNIECLKDLEYTVRLLGGLQPAQRYAQQAPSGDLRQMALQLDNKAHNDRPILATALRVGVVGAGHEGPAHLAAIASIVHLFQHGGRSLEFITETAYRGGIGQPALRGLFARGLVYRPGFLLNSWELTGLVHMMAPQALEERSLPIEILNPLPLRTDELMEGTPVGDCEFAGRSTPVHIPPNTRFRHTHLIGGTGMGKSTTLETMILDDIRRGIGVAVLDPHGDLIERLLRLIPDEAIDRTIYFNPGDRDGFIPIWNPLQLTPGQDPGRLAEDLVGSFKGFLSASWGDRLEHLLRSTFYSLCQLPGSTFLDAYCLFQNTSQESKHLQQQILARIDNESVRKFFTNDFQSFRKDDLNPPKNKLSKILVSDSVYLMLSQPDSAFTMRNVLEESRILLADLSTIGGGVREVLGCFQLGLIYQQALTRSGIAEEKRRAFHAYCDDAHRFMTDAMEYILAEARKYRVSLTLAHVYLEQFSREKRGALSGVGNTIVFNVDAEDARRLTKDLGDKVEAEDLTQLKIGEAIFRSGTHVVKIRTPPPIPLGPPDRKCRIINESRRKYYRRAEEIRELIAKRGSRWTSQFTPLLPNADPDAPPPKEFQYDEF